MFRKSKLCTAALVALGGAVAFTALPSFAQTTQSVEVTGSRIKRAAAEGSLPIISVSREELEAPHCQVPHRGRLGGHELHPDGCR